MKKIAMLTLVGVMIVFGVLILFYFKTKPIQVAFVGELSTEKSQLSIEAREGFVYAVQEVNANGGLLGRKIEYSFYDDKIDNDYKETLNAELIKGNEELIIGFNVSAMKPTIDFLKEQNRYLIISPTVSTEALSGLDDAFIKVTVGSRYEVPPLVQHFKKKNLKKIGIIYNKPNEAYSKGISDLLEASFKSEGINISFVYADEGVSKIDEIAALVNTEGLEAIVAIVNSSDFAKISQIVHLKDQDLLLFGTSWAATNDFIDNVGKYNERAFLLETVPGKYDAQKYQKFTKWMIDKTGKPPTFPIEKAYNACQILFEGIRLAKSTDPAAVKQAIMKQGKFQGIETELVIDSKGDAVGEYQLIQVKNGVFKRVD